VIVSERTQPEARLAWRPRGFFAWGAGAAIILLVALGIIGQIMVNHAAPILKGRIIETLSTRFNARVELDSLDVSLVKGLQVSGHGLRIYNPRDVAIAGAWHPLVSVQNFSFRANLRGLFVKPTHAGTVSVSGLIIDIPPHSLGQPSSAATALHPRGKMDITVDHFLCEDSQILIENGNPAKDPKGFVLQRIELWEIGPDAPWRFDATLINALPRGSIHAAGAFGPWNTETPGDSSIAGHYTFDHADLSSINGIRGTLSSVGDFRGQLNRIAVAGTTRTPDFALDSANHPMSLSTSFGAIVDGTTGDTYLNHVQARLRNTEIACKGSVVNIHGQGHVTDLDVDIPNGNLQDLLALAVKTRPVYLTAQITTQAHLHIRPGKESVTRKLAVEGRFTLHRMHFTNQGVQDEVDELSMRAQGHPAEATPGAPVAPSQMVGDFNLNAGRIAFDKLGYTLPGAQVQLTGIYSLDGEQFDFHGNVRTEAEVSQMVSKWWQQLLLKPVDHFLRKDGAGTEVPIKISGTQNKPRFGLDFDHGKNDPKHFHPTINHQF
jgi:hypothetical protein